jgi:hypothetical protein
MDSLSRPRLRELSALGGIGRNHAIEYGVLEHNLPLFSRNAIPISTSRPVIDPANEDFLSHSPAGTRRPSVPDQPNHWANPARVGEYEYDYTESLSSTSSFDLGYFGGYNVASAYEVYPKADDRARSSAPVTKEPPRSYPFPLPPSMNGPSLEFSSYAARYGAPEATGDRAAASNASTMRRLDLQMDSFKRDMRNGFDRRADIAKLQEFRWDEVEKRTPVNSFQKMQRMRENSSNTMTPAQQYLMHAQVSYLHLLPPNSH